MPITNHHRHVRDVGLLDDNPLPQPPQCRQRSECSRQAPFRLAEMAFERDRNGIAVDLIVRQDFQSVHSQRSFIARDSRFSYLFSHHSSTFPCISQRPHGFGESFA